MRIILLSALLALASSSALAEEAGGELRTPAGDSYSFHHQLGALIDEVFRCFSVHMAGMRDNTVLFDGATELLDIYSNGTQPFVFEFETSSRAAVAGDRGPTGPTSIVELISLAGDDLFPEGFEDPESGTPLTDACLEIGIDDTLDFDPPVSVVAATVDFDSPFITDDPYDISSAFPAGHWNGRLSIVFPGFTGLDVTGVSLRLTIEKDAAIFADGFETGDTASWSQQVP